MRGPIGELLRYWALTATLFVYVPSVRAELVAHWSLDGSLQNSVQLIPRAAYFLLDDDAATPALDLPTYVAGPPSLGGAQAVSLFGPADPEGNGGIDGDLLIVFEDELGIAAAAETRNWTLTGWFHIDPNPTFATAPGSGAAGLFLNGEVESGQKNQFGFGVQAAAADQYSLVYHADGQADQATGFHELVEDVWYFVSQVSNEIDDSLSLYLWSDREGDGEPLKSESVGTATSLWLERVYEFEMGGDPCCSERLFDGAIADVRLYNEALSETQLWGLINRDSARPADVNRDGLVDAADIDRLSAAIRDGLTESQFDLNTDQLVNVDDHTYWVLDLVKTWHGDANLDGEFNSGDLVDVLQVGLYEDAVSTNAGWEQGDWDGDGDFTSSDLVLAFEIGGYEQGPRDVTAIVVPEPDRSGLWGLLSLYLLWRIRFIRLQTSHGVPAAVAA